MTAAAEILTLSEFRDHFNPELDAVLAEHTAAAHVLDPEYGNLLEILAAFLARGGKRLRPYLVYLSYTGADGPADKFNDLVRISVSQELYHTAWLIHDDIIDRDLIRYGGPNIAGAYRAKFAAAHVSGGRHIADSLALLAGDINASLATDLILAGPFPPATNLAVARYSAAANFEVFGGEALDVLMPTLAPETVTPARLVNLYRAKTAAYSFRAPLGIGAILAGVPADQLTAIPAVAEPLGIAFQLADDLLGTFGHEGKLGKSVFSDLREGKRTLLLTTALARATPADRRRLEAIAGDPKASYHHLVEVRDIFESSGAHAAMKEMAEGYINQALAALPLLSYTRPVNTALTNLATYFVNRAI